MEKTGYAADALIEHLREKHLTLGFAESCTGGLAAAAVVAVPGASDVFDESYITYSNEAKQRLLGVNPATLARYGAVSRACAQEMAQGARARSNADYALSVTGIAGPDGGTPEKPVGLVYIGFADKNGAFANEFLFKGDRTDVRTASIKNALNLLEQHLLKYR